MRVVEDGCARVGQWSRRDSVRVARAGAPSSPALDRQPNTRWQPVRMSAVGQKGRAALRSCSALGISLVPCCGLRTALHGWSLERGVRWGARRRASAGARGPHRGAPRFPAPQAQLEPVQKILTPSTSGRRPLRVMGEGDAPRDVRHPTRVSEPSVDVAADEVSYGDLRERYVAVLRGAAGGAVAAGPLARFSPLVTTCRSGHPIYRALGRWPLRSRHAVREPPDMARGAARSRDSRRSHSSVRRSSRCASRARKA